MLKSFKTGWKKGNIGRYNTPIWKLELIDENNKKYEFELSVLLKDKEKVDCVLKGFLKEDYCFSIPASKALTDGIFDAGWKDF